MATHLNRSHLHNHFILNPISFSKVCEPRMRLRHTL
ncbi:MAG: hypothetical protein IJY39_03570 [Clostridia bacterium]|nr:hypothetical protein [Clostridia bacterium]